MPSDDTDRPALPRGRSVVAPSVRSDHLPGPVRAWVGTAARVAVAAAFWFAVVLPLALLVLLAGGLDRPSDVATFLVLVGVDGAALVAGRGYAAPRPRED